MQQILDQFSDSIRGAASRSTPLRIRGGGTKDFYGREPRGEVLDTRAYAGIVDYEPTELVVIARSGTPLGELEALLAAHDQMLAFEPPRFGAASTLGGCIATGLSGPRRPFAGSARDHVLGVRILDGKGTDVSFGGRVMKNVAGYDVSRLMVGALGTLGVLLEVAVKVLPVPRAELTLVQERSAAAAIELMNAWGGKPHPISGTCHDGSRLYVRLSGADAAVQAARERLGGDELRDGTAFWTALRDQEHPFFKSREPLWRVSVKSTTAPLPFAEPQLIEWSGALRWVSAPVPEAGIREAATRAGGHATRFRRSDTSEAPFQPLGPGIMKLHRRLKDAFDPFRILNPGRMYPDF